MQRIFFALWPDDDTRARVAAVGEQLTPWQGRRVRPENLHITLAFLGDVEEAITTQLQSVRIPGRGFSVTLDNLGWWRGPRVIWLAPTLIPPALTSLVDTINTHVAGLGIDVDPRPYRPHLTLVRKAARRPPPVEFEPIFWQINGFCLVQSETGQTGSNYKVLCSWPL